MTEYDLVIIGSGAGGQKAAAEHRQPSSRNRERSPRRIDGSDHCGTVSGCGLATKLFLVCTCPNRLG
jgi:hypothetical protein